MSDEEPKPEAPTWPQTVTLETPIQYGKTTISSLEFQRGTMKAVKGIKIDGIPSFDELLMIASRMCAQPVAALELLGPADGAEVAEIALAHFTQCLPGTKRL